MEHADNRTSTDTDGLGHGDGGGINQRKTTKAMIREDRELLAELARLNRSMASLCMRIMDGSGSIAEQRDYADRLIAAGERLRRRSDGIGAAIIEGEVVVDRSLVLPVHAVES